MAGDAASPAAGDAPPLAWAARAAQLGATPASAADGAESLAALWSGGRLAQALQPADLRRLAGYLDFYRVGAGRRLIEQDENGNFMLIVLDGSVAVERQPGSGRAARLAEARPGDVIGEMALLDAGPRFSTCTTRGPCLLAVLETDSLARLMADDAHLALLLMAALARRLSLRLRQVSARLSALLGDD